MVRLGAGGPWAQRLGPGGGGGGGSGVSGWGVLEVGGLGGAGEAGGVALEPLVLEAVEGPAAKALLLLLLL